MAVRDWKGCYGLRLAPINSQVKKFRAAVVVKRLSALFWMSGPREGPAEVTAGGPS